MNAFVCSLRGIELWRRDLRSCKRSSIGDILCSLQLAEEAAPYLQAGQQRQWVLFIEQECDNIRLAIQRSLTAGSADCTARIVCALTNFWVTKSLLREGRRLFEAVLSHPALS